MKKLLILVVLLIGLSIGAGAQNRDFSNKIHSRDTLTNAEAVNVDTSITGAKHVITFYVPVTKISGTVAGSVKYSFSIDGGTTWYLHETDTLTDATNVYSMTINYNPGVKWRVTVATTGTSSSSFEVYMLYRN